MKPVLVAGCGRGWDGSGIQDRTHNRGFGNLWHSAYIPSCYRARFQRTVVDGRRLWASSGGDTKKKRKRKVGVLEKSFCLSQRIVHTLTASASYVYAYTCSTSDFIPISAYLPHIRYTPIYPFSDTAFDLTCNLNLHLSPAAVIHVSIYPTHACYLPGLIHMWHGTHGTQYMYVRRPS